MISGPAQRIVVNLPPPQALRIIAANTETELPQMEKGSLIERVDASRRTALERIHQLHFISRLTNRSFEIEATGKQAGQMGMLQGSLTHWNDMTIIDFRYVPNRNVWLSFGVATAIGILGMIIILPTIVAAIFGVLVYRQARYSERVLNNFLIQLFATHVLPPEYFNSGSHRV